MGADALRDLPTWKEPQRLCDLATPVIVGRGDTDAPGKAEKLNWQGLAELISPDRLAAIQEHQVSLTRIDVSSSDIRARVAVGRTIRYRTPRAVEMYIKTNGLYRVVAEAQ
jgi:nicotinate-nucleotide adenylyltransferase